MRVKNLIEASAEVVTITTLKRGDVYKRIIPAGQFSESKLQYGVVTSIMNNGSDGAIQAIEYSADWTSGVKATVEVFQTETDVALFAALPEEILEHIAEMRQAIDRKVRDAERALDDAQQVRARTEAVLEGLIELSEPETESESAAIVDQNLRSAGSQGLDGP